MLLSNIKLVTLKICRTTRYFTELHLKILKQQRQQNGLCPTNQTKPLQHPSFIYVLVSVTHFLLFVKVVNLKQLSITANKLPYIKGVP